ncbi:ATP/GTP-binding protein [Rhodoblastus sp.]|uniref:AAA family ATPase n=1 Tax=Rhodoblastus sp. TaxID=1962975 RepID=UPI0035B3F872
MIRSLSIRGYRTFERFELTGLGRINLIVGSNNSGKTSVLEALYLLSSAADPTVLWRILARRGERLNIERRQELDASHLFHGHEGGLGAEFSISTRNTATSNLRCQVRESNRRSSSKELSLGDKNEPIGPRLDLIFSGSPEPQVPIIPLTSRGGLDIDGLEVSRRRRPNQLSADAPQYITTESLSVYELAQMWNNIVLTDAEERVLAALRFLVPEIDRIASISAGDNYYNANRGGFMVKLRGAHQPIPIGSLGDGTWRMLALAMALAQSKNSVVLIDEIDTGLHYTVMESMWKFVADAALELNVQVFATSHSADCIASLASICHKNENSNDVTIQRIEPGEREAVRFTEAQIRVAAERNIEVR